jgi:glycosyltransferase involved in cell wall biosynthesis
MQRVDQRKLVLMPKIRMSVALVTRNRPASLERTLQSLREQDAQPFEVIVSDDSDQEYSTAVENVVHHNDCRYLRGPRRGLYANRNHVALACQGTHVRTMDDDHEFPEGHFQKCFQAVEENADSIWIIGEHNAGSAPYFIPPPCPGQLSARGFSFAPADPKNCWAIADGASIYPKVIFDRDLRYVERFKFGAGYLEFGSRLYWLGYRIRQLLTTYVIHHFDRSMRSFEDFESDLASLFFAMLCHSYLYQPTAANKLRCTLEIAKELMRHGAVARRALADAREEFGVIRARATSAHNAGLRLSNAAR